MKNKIIIIRYIPVLITFIVIFLSIGFSAFHDSLIVNDIKGVVRAKADIRLTGIVASSTNNGLQPMMNMM